jgi:hypothetical protein
LTESDEFVISDNKALSYSTFNYYIERLRLETDFEEKLSLYCIRRDVKNAVNSKFFFRIVEFFLTVLDNANKNVRDQIMRHDSQSNIFQAYLNRRADCHVQIVFFEQFSADELIKIFSHMSIKYDSRVSIVMPEEIFDRLSLDSEIIELQRRRDRLKMKIQIKSTIVQTRERESHTAQKYDKIVIVTNAVRVKRRKNVDRKYRENYFYKRHTEEIERQINDVKRSEYVESLVQHQLSKRIKLIDLLCDIREDVNLEEILQRRLLVINLMRRMCRLREVQRHHR